MKTTSACFDPETIAVLKAVLEDSWATLRPDQQRAILKTDLAQRILAAAADGERDPIRLREHALATFVQFV
jgi:hypothetical protein